MNSQQRQIARLVFQNKILKATGTAFEDIFTQIMDFGESGFRQIKPQGQTGDRKNDGYIKDTGTFFQVYSPEKPDSKGSPSKAMKKACDDFVDLMGYQRLLSRYKNDKARAVLKLKEENVRTNDYLADVKDLLESNMKAFVSLSSQFYEEKPGGITVENNEGDNQLRFNIVARIEDDASDGINEVKIFCFDMMILRQKHNHAIDFLFHDSRLFSDMDHRQRATALHVVLEETRSWDYQYIATLNEDQLHACRECLKADDWQKLEASKILELTDESPKSKLLGVEVDMRYDE